MRACGMSYREIRELVAELEPRPDVTPSARKLPERPGRRKESPLPLARTVPSNGSPLLPEGAAPSNGTPLLPVRPAPGSASHQQLGAHRVEPDADLARIIDIAVTEKLQRVEAKRFGKLMAPRTRLAETDTTASSRHIPAAGGEHGPVNLRLMCP